MLEEQGRCLSIDHWASNSWEIAGGPPWFSGCTFSCGIKKLDCKEGLWQQGKDKGFLLPSSPYLLYLSFAKADSWFQGIYVPGTIQTMAKSSKLLLRGPLHYVYRHLTSEPIKTTLGNRHGFVFPWDATRNSRGVKAPPGTYKRKHSGLGPHRTVVN